MEIISILNVEQKSNIVYCYLNGKILPIDEARISPQDLGVLRGYGVFEFLRTYNGKPFLLDQHLKRFFGSVKSLNLKIKVNRPEINAIIKELITQNRLPEANIKLVLTGGPSPDGISIVPNASTFYILVNSRQNQPETFYKNGVKLITHEFQRDFHLTKTTNYITAISLQDKCKKSGAIEILYIYNGQVTECSRSSFLVFKNNTLIIPKDNILSGITSNLVTKLAKNQSTGGFQVQKRAILYKELRTASEALITSTDKEIMPVVKIDDLIIGNGKPGKNTLQLINSLRDFTSRY